MVVDHSRGLHQRVANRGADEAEAALRQVFAQCVGLFRARRNLALPGVLFRFAIDKAPDVRVEAAKFLLRLQERTGVADGGSDLQAIADDAGVSEQLPHFLCPVAGHFFGIESVEYFLIALPFAQHGVPAQSRLRAFQSQHLKPSVVVVQRHAPLFVVIGNIPRFDAQRHRTRWSEAEGTGDLYQKTRISGRPRKPALKKKGAPKVDTPSGEPDYGESPTSNFTWWAGSGAREPW